MTRRAPSHSFRGMLAFCCVLAGIVVVQLPAGVATAAPVSAVGGEFVPAAARLLDTRNGIGAPAGAVAGGHVVSLALPAANVPATATAVRLNVTAVSPTADTYLTVYPDGTARPISSSLNVPAGGLLSNLVTVKVGAGGRVDFYNYNGSVQIIADLVGYDTPDVATANGDGRVFSALPPTRVLDTRNSTGGHQGRVGAGGVVPLRVTGLNGVPSAGVGTVVLNVTVVGPSTASYVTVWADGGSRPGTSNLNFSAGQTVPNLVIAPVSAAGVVDLYNNAGTVDLLVDVAGYGSVTNQHVSRTGHGADGALFAPVAPTRILDTRNATGVGTTTPVGANQAISVAVAGHDGVPAGATAVALNVTATAATAATYVTVYPGGTTRPVASSLNVSAGVTIANQVIVPVGPDGTVAFYNHVGTVHLIADLAGYYTTGASSSWHTAQAPVPAGTAAGSGVTLAGTACDGSGGCVATGYTNSGKQSEALLLSWDGTGWTSVDAPLPADAAAPHVAFFDQAPVCPSAGTCLALGSYQTTGGGTAYMVVRGFGGTWTTGALPLLAGAVVGYEPSLACGPTGCVAVTSYRLGSGAEQLMLVTGDPGTDVTAWTPRQAPAPAGGGITGGGGAACGPAACVAEAVRTDPSGTISLPYLVSGSGGTWTEADAPLPAGDSPPVAGSGTRYELDGAFCDAAACALTGSYWPTGDEDGQAVILSGDGSSWAAVNLPRPSDAAPGAFPVFESMDCLSASQCAGTAYYGNDLGFDDDGGLLVSGGGTQWTAVPLTGPDGADRPNGTFTVACPATTCVVAGGYRDVWGVGQLAVGGGTVPVRSSDTWASQKATPAPHADSNAPGAPGLRVACASAAVCVAVGGYVDNTNTPQGVLLTGTAGALTQVSKELNVTS